MIGITPCKAPVFERRKAFIFLHNRFVEIVDCAMSNSNKNGSNGASKHPNEPDHKPLKRSE